MPFACDFYARQQCGTRALSQAAQVNWRVGAVSEGPRRDLPRVCCRLLPKTAGRPVTRPLY